MGAASCSLEKGLGGGCISIEDGKDKEKDEDKGSKKKKGKGKKDEETSPVEKEAEPSSPTIQRSGSSLQRSGSTLKRSGSSVGMQGEQKKKTDMIRYERNLKRMRKVALDVSGELNHFSVFLKKHFANPSEAFNGISGSEKAASVEMEKFIDGLQKIEFGGDENKVFYGLCDDQAWGSNPIITRDGFVKRLGSMGNPFIQVVRQACLRDRSKIKKKVAEAMKEKNRDPEIVEEFRKFIEPLFPTPGKCFDAIAGDDGNIDEDEFVEWLVGVDFKGDASKVFHNFCDGDGYITRIVFTNILVAGSGDANSAENPQEADSGKKAKSRSSKQDEENESPESPSTASPKRKSKKKATNLDMADGGGEEPESSKKKPAPRRKSISGQGDDAIAEDVQNAAKPRRKSISGKSPDGAEGEDPVTPKTLKRSPTSGGDKNDDSPAKGKSKAKAKQRRNTAPA